MIRSFPVVLALLFTFACDRQGPTSGQETVAKPGPASPADPIGEVADCLGRCYAAEGAPDACVAACKAEASRAAAPPASEVLDRLSLCVSTCHEGSTLPTNRETCELNCAQVARVAASPPPSSTPPATP